MVYNLPVSCTQVRTGSTHTHTHIYSHTQTHHVQW